MCVDDRSENDLNYSNVMSVPPNMTVTAASKR